MGYRERSAYRDWMEEGLPPDQAAAAATQPKKYDVAKVLGKYWESLNAGIVPDTTQVNDYEMALEWSRADMEHDLRFSGMEPEEARVWSERNKRRLLQRSQAPSSQDGKMTRHVLKQQRPSAEDLRQRADEIRFDPAKIATTDSVIDSVEVETPSGSKLVDLGLSVQNIDRKMALWRDLAAGQMTDAVLEFSALQRDLQGMDAVFSATLTAGQQAWWGLQIGESAETVIERRLWPTTIIENEDGEDEKKAIPLMAMEHAFRRTALGLLAASPFSINRGFRDWVREKTDEARDDMDELLDTDWYEGILRADDVHAYHYSGYGIRNVFGSHGPAGALGLAHSAIMYGNPDMPAGNVISPQLDLPDPGTPEREAIDEEVQSAWREHLSSVGHPGWFGSFRPVYIEVATVGREVFDDPGLLLGEFAPAAITGMRRALAISSQARHTAAVARHTGHLNDVADALNDAEKWRRSALNKLSKRGLGEDGRNALRDELTRIKNQHPQIKEIRKLRHLRKKSKFGGDRYRRYHRQLENLEAAHPQIDRMQRIRAQLAHQRKLMQEAAQAEDNFLRLRSMFAKAKRGPNEQIMVNNLPRANPAYLARVSDVYLESNPEVAIDRTLTVIGEMHMEAAERVKLTEQALENTPRTVDRTDLTNRLAQAQEDLEELGNLKQWMESKAENPEGLRLTQAMEEARMLAKPFAPRILDMTPARGTPVKGARSVPLTRETVSDEIYRNIRRGMVEGADETTLMQWELTYRMVQDGSISPQAGITRINNVTGDDLIKMDIKSSRIAANLKTPDTLNDISLIEDPTVAYNRATAGPDAAEQSGNAAMRLAAGGDINDVDVRIMTVDTYLNSYGMRPHAFLGMDESPNAILGAEAFKTTVEAAKWQQSLYESMSDMFMKGLTPRTWVVRPTRFLQIFRETAWALDSVNPRLGRMMQNAYAAQELELQRLLSLFGSELRALGVLDEAGNINEELSRHFARILNLSEETEAFKAAYAGLSFSEQRSIRRIRQTMDFLANKQGLRNTDRRLTGYLSHILKDGEQVGGALDPGYSGIPVSEVVHHPWMEARTKDPKKIEIDLVTALDRYTRGATKKLHIEPMLETLRAAGTKAAEVDPKLGWFHAYVEHLIGVMQGRPSVLGSFVEHQMANRHAWERGRKLLKRIAGYGDEGVRGPGSIRGRSDQVLPEGAENMAPISSSLRRNIHSTVYGASTLAYMGALAGNRRYFPMAVATGLATTGGRYGLWRTAEGIIGMADPQMQKAAKQAGILGHLDELFDPVGGGDHAKSIQRVSEKLSNTHLLSPSLQFTENTIRGWTFHAALSELMSKTGFRNIDEVKRAGLLNSYLAEAQFATSNINHRFGMLGRPPMFRRFSESGTTAYTQFLTFPYKQVEALAAMTRENPGHIARFMAYSGAIARIGSGLGVDLGQYVEIPGVSDFDTRSIFYENMSSLLDLTTEIHKTARPGGGGDPVKLDDLFKRVSTNAMNFVPVSNAIESYINDYSRLVRGAEFQSSGEKIRDLNLGDFEWEGAWYNLENLKNIPGNFAEPGTTNPTEMISILTGLRSTSANLEKTRYDALKEEVKRAAYIRRQISDRMNYGLLTGDMEPFNEALEEAMEKDIVLPNLGPIIDKSMYTHALPRILQLQASQFDELLEVIERQSRTRVRD